MNSNLVPAFILSASVAAPLVAQQSFAASPEFIEQITVTAQRRAESMQDVPIAITALTASELEARNVTTAADLLRAVPNLVGNEGQGIGPVNSYYLRGLGITESIATVDPAVGTYIDDIYMSRTNANNLSLFDVERIEVMRGPQGTLFGRNTTGGAVHVILKKPGDELGGFAELAYGNYNSKLVRGSIDLPVSERLRTKLTGFYLESDGWVKNTTTGETLNDEETYGVRGALQASLGESGTWDLAFTNTSTTATNILNFECDPAKPSVCDDRYSTTGLRAHPGSAASQFPVSISGPKAFFPLGADTDTQIATSSLQFDLGAANLELITGYVRIGQEFALDFTDGRASPSLTYGLTPQGTVAPTTIVADPPVTRRATGGFVILNDARHAQFSQEMKLAGSLLDGRVDYVSGLFFLRESNTTDLADVFTVAANGAVLVLADRTFDNTARNVAGYAQFDYDLSERWTATLGVRYTDERKEFGIYDNRALSATPVPATRLDTANLRALGIPTEQQEKIWTPRVAFEFRPADDVMVFGSATRGFRSGGWSARATSPASLLPFGSEKVWSYELGTKVEWFNHRLRLNVTGFYLEADDLQVPTGFPNALGVLTFVTGNFAKLENKGAEIELVAKPANGLNLFASFALQDASFSLDPNGPVSAQLARCQAGLANVADTVDPSDTRSASQRAQQFCGNGIVTASGEIAQPARTPEFSFLAGASYEIPLGKSLRLTPSFDVHYSRDYETLASNLSFFRATDGSFNASGGEFLTGSRAEARAVVTANLALDSLDGRWRAALECKNCLDETYVQSTIANYSFLGMPRTYGLRMRYTF